MEDYTLHLHFCSPERESMAKIAYEAAEKGLPFAVQLTYRVTFFNPANYTALDSASKTTFQYNSLKQMMLEVSALMFVAKKVYVVQKEIGNDKRINN